MHSVSTTSDSTTSNRPAGHGLGLCALFLLVNLITVVLLSFPDQLPELASAYLNSESMFLTLATIDATCFLLMLPVLSNALPRIQTPQVAGEAGDATPENPLVAVFRRGAWAAALYEAVVLSALALPFLLLASRVAPLAPAALPTTLVCLLVIVADLSLLNRLVGRWYYPLALGIAALPPLVDYLALDLLNAQSAILTTLSPVGLIVAAAESDALELGGLTAPRGALLFLLLFLAMAVLAPVPEADIEPGPKNGQFEPPAA